MHKCKHLRVFYDCEDIGTCKDCGEKLNGRKANEKVFGRLAAWRSDITYDSLLEPQEPYYMQGSLPPGVKLIMEIQGV